MKTLKAIPALLMLMTVALMSTACHDEPDEPTPVTTTTAIADAIVGKWLLATSTGQEWTVYEFKKNQQMTSEWFINNTLVSGTGSYFTNNEQSSLSGTINDGRGNYINIDWKASKIRGFQVDIDVFGGADGNQYVTSTSLYRIMGEQEIEPGSVTMTDYRKFTGSNDCSGFSSIDETIVTVNSRGEITSTGTGSTYVVFETPAGHAAIKITSAEKMQSLSTSIRGTWVTDNKGYTWERDVFGDNGYFYAQWSREVIYPTSDESAQGTYTVNESDKTISVSAQTPYQLKLNVDYRITRIDKFSFDTDIYSGGDKTGAFYFQRVLSSITLEPQGTEQPNYFALAGAASISGYSSHDSKIATVDETTGLIKGVSEGITYIDVITGSGTGVIEVKVSGGVIPYAFEDCLGKPSSKVKEMFGNPYYEDATTIIYKNLTNTIDIAGMSLDSFSGLVKGITITYNSNIKTEDVTASLDAKFIPFMKQTTETFKAYMDAAERKDASIGVTWDIPTRTLVYVNLATDLFTDYSVLLGMTRSEVISKMGKEPDSQNEQSQNYFFFDNKGIKIVSAYYTDFVNDYDNVRSVVTMFDDTLTDEQITDYLKKKYPYYPEYSTDNELVFIPDGHLMEIYYMPKDKMIMYISTANASKAVSHVATAARLRHRTKSINR